MIHINREDIASFDRLYRLNLINSLPGYKSANLIGTADSEGRTNLAIFSTVTHMGSNPPLIGFITRPTTVPRHTYQNIKETGYYTINHVHESFIEKAHYTSAKFDLYECEFEKVNLTKEYRGIPNIPYIAESQLKIGLAFRKEIPIDLNQTILVIGEVQEIYIDEDALGEDGIVDLNQLGTVCISGLESYHKVQKISSFPYARKQDLPDFSGK